MRKIEPKVVRFKLRDLRPAAYNPRVIGDEALAGLSASIKKFGCVEPIVVNTRGGKNTIIGGHQRCRVLCDLHGRNYSCLCVAVDLNKIDEKLLNLTLNNPEIQGQFVEELGRYIDELRESLSNDNDYLALQINALRNEYPGAERIGLTGDDAVPELPKKPQTKPGDLWQLDGHRLLCGDSTKMTDILKLIGKKKAKMCFTSPPYNIAGGMYENYKDSLKSAAYINFNLTVANNVKQVLDGFLFWNISYNSNSRWEFIEIFYRMIKECGFTFLENIVWDKEKAMPITGKTGLTRQYEDVLLLTNQEIGYEVDFCFVGTTKRMWAFNKKNQRGVSNYWRIPVKDDTQLKNLKACFPVALPCKAIDLMSEPKDLVIESFSGSGTTIIAAEKLDRRCYAIELEPTYCDVAVKRWEEWTGKKARLIRAPKGPKSKTGVITAGKGKKRATRQPGGQKRVKHSC